MVLRFVLLRPHRRDGYGRPRQRLREFSPTVFCVAWCARHRSRWGMVRELFFLCHDSVDKFVESKKIPAAYVPVPGLHRSGSFSGWCLALRQILCTVRTTPCLARGFLFPCLLPRFPGKFQGCSAGRHHGKRLNVRLCRQKSDRIYRRICRQTHPRNLKTPAHPRQQPRDLPLRARIGHRRPACLYRRAFHRPLSPP